MNSRNHRELECLHGRPGREVVVLGQQIDALIEIGWRVLESDFDERVFEQWREEARNCLAALTGDDNRYSDYLEPNRDGTERLSLLTGIGVLSAAMLGHSPTKDYSRSTVE